MTSLFCQLLSLSLFLSLLICLSVCLPLYLSCFLSLNPCLTLSYNSYPPFLLLSTTVLPSPSASPFTLSCTSPFVCLPEHVLLGTPPQPHNTILRSLPTTLLHPRHSTWDLSLAAFLFSLIDNTVIKRDYLTLEWSTDLYTYVCVYIYFVHVRVCVCVCVYALCVCVCAWVCVVCMRRHM